MDILDPLESSENESKVILQQGLDIEEHSMGSDDVDDPQVEHLSPQTLLETPEEDVQYSFRTPDGTVTYGVLKVEEDVPQVITSQNLISTTVPQILTSNINGHLYVVSNASDLFVSHPATGPRPIAPRGEGNSGTGTHIMKKGKKDERRRATHNEVERRRRDKINNWINKLAKLIPESTTGEMTGNGHYDGQSKGGILSKACEYIMEIRESHTKLEESEAERARLAYALEEAKRKTTTLDEENKALRKLLQEKGVQVVQLMYESS